MHCITAYLPSVCKSELNGIEAASTVSTSVTLLVVTESAMKNGQGDIKRNVIQIKNIQLYTV